MEVVDAGIPGDVIANLDDTRDLINLKINEAIFATQNGGVEYDASQMAKSVGMAAKKLVPWLRCFYVYSVLAKVSAIPYANALEYFLMRLPQASKTAVGKIYRPDEDDTKYKGGFGSLVYKAVVAPVLKVDGVLVGTDKIGHFVEIGYDYFVLAHKGIMPVKFQPNVVVYSDGRRIYTDDSETGVLGLVSTGVYSNADLEANNQGKQFYVDLWNNPRMSIDIRRYISDKWNEGSNPNYYTQEMAEEVWTNLLALHWFGRITSNGSERIMPISLATTGSKIVSGTYARPDQGSSVPGQMSGTIEYQKNKTLNDAVTGIVIPFKWTEPTESGTGKLTSVGEDTLKGTWGTDAAGTNRGKLELDHN